MMDKSWKLGEDLFTSDPLLDGFSFDDLILALHCNFPKVGITASALRKTLLEDILAARLTDMHFLVQNNMDEILERARNYGVYEEEDV